MSSKLKITAFNIHKNRISKILNENFLTVNIFTQEEKNYNSVIIQNVIILHYFKKQLFHLNDYIAAHYLERER